MLPITNETKVGKFWDYELEKINEETKKEIIMLVSFREKVLTKLNTKEWTEEEYKHFTSTIKQIRLKNFIEFIEIANTIIEMPQIKCYKELINLLNKKIIETNPNYKSVPHMIACVINEIESRLFGISVAPITEKEKKFDNNIEDSIYFYESLYQELNNEDSVIIKIFNESFTEWVNNNFITSELKTTLLNQKQTLINKKKDTIKAKIKILYSKQAIIKEAPISHFKKEVKSNEIKRHGLRPMYNQ